MMGICDHHRLNNRRIPITYSCFWNSNCVFQSIVPCLVFRILSNVSRRIDESNLLQVLNDFDRILNGNACNLIAEIFRVYFTFPGN
ncbi:hypothetical protein NY2A_b072L [Paramecium bursaria Chlorella virus NY2A]|uniref:Uncharacterized protein b072L n=1 Tax=Paramecium bursaria Chlorella virus NY2A TaxID=46021 RepID=A7IVU7_PBCVN|nr:hypothetical protein NY2A_b072L [Paramecium bursaria Chlorella virus NY2A]ABT14471.1 hypothetical protein NY2A_b072L [Paramecium bursaria Chlorella virus NY2A]